MPLQASAYLADMLVKGTKSGGNSPATLCVLCYAGTGTENGCATKNVAFSLKM